MTLAALAPALPRLAAGQAVPPATARAGATVGGVVRDSLAHHPLAGAIVQLVDAERNGSFSRTTSSDSLGRFTFDNVPDGHFLIGFLHPALDAIGLEEPAREVFVKDARPVRIDLALPSARRLRAAICRTDVRSDSSGMVLGFVRGAVDGAAIEGASVVGQWAELAFTKAGLTRTIPRLVATTASNGWFALCGVPTDGTVVLSAAHGADSSAQVEVEVPSEGFVHRDIYVGAARATTVVDSSVVRTVVGQDSSAHVDSAIAVPRLMRTGVGRLSGTVRRSPGDAPLAGAQVSIVDGPRTRADDRGNWTIGDAPLGTRMLEVRAVGYYPERKAVDVLRETPPVQTTLSTLKAILDTVRVRATMLYSRDRNGFQQRRRSGLGRYITPEDIDRRRPLLLSDLLRTMPGMFLQTTDMFSHQLMMRGTGRGYCAPSVYLDGMPMEGLSTDDIDAFVRPGDVTGIEVYSGTTAPPQFTRSFSGCGSIVIWTR
jgi:hypothetical protein